MPEQLIEELRRYQEYAQKLRNLIEEDDELEVIMHESSLTALQAIEYAITIRIHNVSEQLERAQNEALNNFINRRIT